VHLTMRKYRDEDDYGRLRAFLRQTFLLNDRRELNWQAYRLDYWRWHGIMNLGQGPLEETVFIWETAADQIVAVLNPEDPGVAYLQVHPEFRSADLVAEMLTVAEAHLAVSEGGGRSRLQLTAHAADTMYQRVLASRSYTNCSTVSYHHRRSLSEAIVEPELPPGYTVRALGGVEELPARSLVSWRAFHPDEAEEKYEGWSWYLNVQRAPLYRRDLDIVAVAPSGELAAFCTIWFDEVTRTGGFEPVGTVPAHQRRGLGKAVMFEGLRRLRDFGATLATVGAESSQAHAFYLSAGFTSYDLLGLWERVL
jgi:mycothiol synthase